MSTACPWIRSPDDSTISLSTLPYLVASQKLQISMPEGTSCYLPSSRLCQHGRILCAQYIASRSPPQHLVNSRTYLRLNAYFLSQLVELAIADEAPRLPRWPDSIIPVGLQSTAPKRRWVVVRFPDYVRRFRGQYDALASCAKFVANMELVDTLVAPANFHFILSK